MASEPKVKVWMEDGILYNEYYNGINSNTAREALEKGIEILKESGKVNVPAISVFNDVTMSNFSVRPMDLANFFRNTDIENYYKVEK